MPTIDLPDTILAHPALAGCTLFVRRAGQWAAFEIESEGRLAPVRLVADPAAHAWRGGSLG